MKVLVVVERRYIVEVATKDPAIAIKAVNGNWDVVFRDIAKLETESGPLRVYPLEGK